MIITGNNNVLLFAHRFWKRSLRQSLFPVDPILPANPFTFRSVKAVGSDQQSQGITDRMKADTDPGGMKTERSRETEAK